jgi:murein DD-endopeptidase MepM/ murein hydrolase activator NlpD
LKRNFIRLLFLSLIIGLCSSMPTTLTHAQQAIVINPEFEYIRQGSFGVMTITGGGIVGATAEALERTYPFFPTSQGLAAFIAVPMDTKIRDYPIAITLIQDGGASAKWEGTIKVASGEFIKEDKPISLPGDKLFLLSDEIQQSEDHKLFTTYSIVTPARYWDGPFSVPLQGQFISAFGSWRAYNGNILKRHAGQDIRASVGMPVMAVSSGRVVLSRPLDIHGESVVIDHGWGIFSEYSHLSARYVVPGQFVLQGDVLGLSGNTGRSTGPHLHWEMAVNGVWVSPIMFREVKLPN